MERRKKGRRRRRGEEEMEGDSRSERGERVTGMSEGGCEITVRVRESR